MPYTYAFTNSKNTLVALVISDELSSTAISAIEGIVTGSMKYQYPPVYSQIGKTLEVGKVQLNESTLQWTPYTRILSKYGFNKLFTMDELVALQVAAKTNDVVAVLQNKFNIADEINLDEIDVKEGLQYLVSVGILTANRLTEILS